MCIFLAAEGQRHRCALLRAAESVLFSTAAGTAQVAGRAQKVNAAAKEAVQRRIICNNIRRAMRAAKRASMRPP
jgi:hypothetical protein